MNEKHIEYIRKHRNENSVKEFAEALGITCEEVKAIYEANFKEWEKIAIKRPKKKTWVRKARQVIGYPVASGDPIRFESAMAAESQGFHPTAIYACINGKHQTHKGYIWKYADENINIDEIKKGIPKRKTKAVVGFPVAGGDPIRFDVIRHATAEGFNAGLICECASGKRKTYKGYTWKYAEEETHDKD